jgi:hypothetical protein
MNLKKLFISTILIVMIIAWASSAIITVIPDSTASKVCHLGYYAHCSFTPYGTIISIVGAVLTYFVARKLNCLKF